jgi:hypothetical protein
VFSAALAWRLVNVVAHSADKEQRRSAVTMFGMVWGTGSLGAGVLGVSPKLHELGLL